MANCKPCSDDREECLTHNRRLNACERIRLESRIKELEEALETISKHGDKEEDYCEDSNREDCFREGCQSGRFQMGEIARQALKGGKI